MLELFHQPARRLVMQAMAIIAGVFFFTVAQAAQVTLAWDPNDPVPDGYRVFLRTEGSAYDYSSPIWPQSGDNPQTTACTIDNLADATTYYFVVRAHVGNDQSGDSNEISYRYDPPAPTSYTLSVSAAANGGITPGTTTVDAGDSQTFSISPQAHYHIADVQVDGNSIGAVAAYTFNAVNADHTISAIFAIDRFDISANAGNNGSISPSGTVSVGYGSSKTFSIAPDTGYHIADVLVDGVSSGAVSSYTFNNISAAHTISASFMVNTYAITATAGNNGAILPSGTVNAGYGLSKTFSIAADAGYHIADVLVDGVSAGAVGSYTFNNISAGHTIVAVFEADTLTISSSAGLGGTILPGGQVAVTAGAVQSFNLTADVGYKIQDLVVDGVSLGAQNSYTFVNIQSNHTIVATFDLSNQPPVADAGPDQVADEAQVVTLSGANSTDADDGIAIFQWRQVQGTPVILSAPGQEITTFQAPDVDMGGQALVFELTVTDAMGASSKDTCIVNVTWVNQVPAADAGADQTVTEGHLVTLDATGSTDSDDGIASYVWVQVQGPAMALSDPQSATPSFAAPDVGPQGASLTFQVTVTDAGGLQDTDSCQVTVTWQNAAPVADAGADQVVAAGADVDLDGSLSMDPDGTSLLYQWRQTDGPPVTLSDATAMQPVFAAPGDNSADMVLTFELTVTDAGGLQGVDTCQVTVQAAVPAPIPGDTNPPLLTINNPVGDYVVTGSSKLDIAGTAWDDRQVDRVEWVNDRGQSGEATGTDSWAIDQMRLHHWENTITITAYDPAGNSSSKTITISVGSRN